MSGREFGVFAVCLAVAIVWLLMGHLDRCASFTAAAFVIIALGGDQ